MIIFLNSHQLSAMLSQIDLLDTEIALSFELQSVFQMQMFAVPKIDCITCKIVRPIVQEVTLKKFQLIWSNQH